VLEIERERRRMGDKKRRETLTVIPTSLATSARRRYPCGSPGKKNRCKAPPSSPPPDPAAPNPSPPGPPGCCWFHIPLWLPHQMQVQSPHTQTQKEIACETTRRNKAQGTGTGKRRDKEEEEEEEDPK